MLRNASILIKIEPGRVDPGRFWWSVCDDTCVLARSPFSYATRREAESAASEALKRQELERNPTREIGGARAVPAKVLSLFSRAR